MIFNVLQQKTNAVVCPVGTDVLVLMVFAYALNKIIFTGFDTSSFLHVVGKIKGLKKCFHGKEKLRLLNTIGVSCKVSETAVKDVEKFIQTVCYSGKEEKGSN